MKLKLLRQILIMSKLILYGIFLQALFCGLLLANEGNAQRESIHDIKVNIDHQKTSVASALAELELKTDFNFTYTDAIRKDKEIRLNRGENTVADLLVSISKQTGLRFTRVNNNIHISKYRNNSQELVEEILEPQQFKITGKVTAAYDAEPLPGVSIIIKGTSTGTSTNLDGEYSLNVNPDDVLSFSYIGYQTFEIAVANQSVIDVALEVDTEQLEEVVVIGYGTRESKDITGAVSQIGTDEIKKSNTMSPEFAMQGKMTGVYVSNPGSNPNARPQIRIRGVSTLGHNDPLYVIDGVPIYEGGSAARDSRTEDLRGDVNIFNMINPNDIESISVLKDASASAIYGVRASNGVILITTKRGSKGKMKVNFSAKTGIQNVYKKYDLLNTQQYVDIYQEAMDNNPSYSPDPNVYRFYDPTSSAYLGNSPTYDWQDDQRINNALIQDYNASVSGGTEFSNFSMGAGYSSQENPIYSDDFERYSYYINSDHNLTSWLKVGESYRIAYTKSDFNNQGGIFAAPWQPLYDENGPGGFATTTGTVDGVQVLKAYGNGTNNNFLGVGNYEVDQYTLMRNMGSFYAEVSPFSGFRIRGTLSLDYYSNEYEQYDRIENGLFRADIGILDPSGNTYNNRETVNSNLVKEFLIGYNKSFGNHNFDLILNATDQRVNWNIKTLGIGNNSPISSFDQRRVDEGWNNEDKGAFYERYRSGLQGYMARVSYSFKDKYYLDATVRRDGSSKFGPGYKWGTFPSFAAAWRISDEVFMQSFDWLTDLKFRGGWGQTGNQETVDFAYLSLVNYNPKYALGSGGEAEGDGVLNPAAVLGDFPIVDMSWETVSTTTVGFDAAFFNNKFTLTAEYYSRLTDDILQTINIPLVIGALNNPVVNLAKVKNTGFEFQAGYSGNVGQLHYNVSGNLTTVKNEVTDIYLGRPQGGSERIEEGYPINYIYGYQVGGIFQSQAEVDAWMEKYSDPGYESQKSPGDIYYLDLHSNPNPEIENEYVGPAPDSIINQYDRTYLGKTIPGYYYGLSFSFNYKNWDLGIDFRGVGDVQKVNGVRQTGENMQVGGSNFLASTLNRWTDQNHSTSMPRAVAEDPSGNTRFSSRWVEDADFLRLQNIQLGYTFDQSILNKLGVGSLRCYVSGSNLFVVSSYSGLDPENDFTPTTFIGGLNINF